VNKQVAVEAASRFYSINSFIFRHARPFPLSGIRYDARDYWREAIDLYVTPDIRDGYVVSSLAVNNVVLIVITVSRS
jgi:hypothetical protein